MKKYNWLRLIVLSLFTMINCISYAYDFEVGGFFFNIVSESDREVSITHEHDDEWALTNNYYYTYNIIIPESVTYQDKTYTIVAIDDFTFFGCYLMQSIAIPNTVRSIGNYAFRGCTTIHSITLPNSITSIGDYSFQNCNELGTITLSSNLKSIGSSAFVDCNSLSNITLPKTLLAIGSRAFNSCKHLTSVTIPSSVISIGESAFFNCKLLNEVNSEIKNPFAIDESVFNLIRSTAILKVPSGTKSKYQQFSGWTKYFTDIIEDYAYYTCSIKASGYGSVTYINDVIRDATKSYSLEEGSSVSLFLAPDNGYQIKSVKVNNTDATSNVSNNTYTISNISSDTAIEVEFEAIPPTTYTLSIKATGNGSVSYAGETIRGTTKSYTVNEGASVLINFTPDNGYRIKSVKVNSTVVSASTSYTVTMTGNTTVEVEFEAIPPTTYTLSIKATGNGSASYSGSTIRGTTKTFTINEGTSATISFTPDNGYRIKSVKANGIVVTANTSYTVTVNSNTTVEIEFEAIPITTYTLSIKATGNGSASYSGSTIRGTTKSFTVNEGTSAIITFSPDNGYRIKSLKVNNVAVTASTSYTVTVNSNTTVEVEFETMPVNPTSYTLSIKAIGNGSASYSGSTIRGTTKSFTVNEGTSATISFSPDNGYRIKSVKVNSVAVTASASYTVTVNSNTTVEVEFEALPVNPTTYTLSIKATGNGSASYSGSTIRGTTKSFTVNEGTSATITFSPDNGYRIKSVKVNNSAVTASTSYTVTVNSNTTVEVEFEAIPITTYTLSIKATGNGSASYSGTTIRATTKSFTVNEGTSATVSFSPDNGYRIKSVKVNNSAVTASASYTVTVNSNTTVEVEFEAIPIVTYTLSIKATGNGSASYGGETIRGTTKSYTLNSGTSATMAFTPDNGYQIKSLKVNNSSISASTNYTVTMSGNTSVEVEFEAIPENPVTTTTYTLSIQASGNGSASYGGKTIRDKSSSFTVDEGSKASISFIPDEGYQIKSLKVNGSSVAVSSTYEVTVKSDTSVKVEFEQIPENPDAPSYSLSIKASGNGIASYDGETTRDNTFLFTVIEGTSATITFTPDGGYEINSVTVNGSDVTSETSNHQYTLVVNADTSVEVTFKESESQNAITIDGITYQIISDEEHTLMLVTGDYGLTLVVPEKIEFLEMEWTVIGVANDALENSEELAAIIWNPAVPFNARVSNPNLLLYVRDEAYAPANIENVVVNGFAKYIKLMDAQSGNNFYCPETFTAQSIDYTHSYYMKTGFNESGGWETLTLPFDVQQISHSSKGEIVPFTNWTSGSYAKPFWLYEMSGNGFVEAEAIKANTPYIISMPNNEMYPNEYQLTGRVIFSAENATVESSDDMQTSTSGNRTLVPNYLCRDADSDIYALNVSNDYEYYRGAENEGSMFILNLRKIHPFEAYMTSTSGTRTINVFDGTTMAIRGIEEMVSSQGSIKVYDLSGRLIKTATTMESIKQELPIGVYIVNNKKVIIK